MNSVYLSQLDEFLHILENMPTDSRHLAWEFNERMVYDHLIRPYGKLIPDVWAGISVLPGWIPIIGKLFANVMGVVDVTPGLTVNIAQVKEKFGDLNIYVRIFTEHGSSSETHNAAISVVHEMVREAEVSAIGICETCGSPGDHTEYGWIKTACEKHK